MRPFRKTETKTTPADIGRTVPPTPEQAARFAELRSSGSTPLQATRAVRVEAARKSRS